jgi:hypothetical protein
MISCVDIGEPRETKAECEGYSAGLQDALGEPPTGAYFWPRHDLTLCCWQVQLCFDDNNEAHRRYATQLAMREV